MIDLASDINQLPSLRATVETHGLMAKKALGQNFLLDSNITDKIIRLSLEKQNLNDFAHADVFEIGPGPGGLTRAILKANPKKLTAVEMDDRCIAIMEEIKALHTVTLKSTNCFLPTNNVLNLLRNVEHADSQSPLNLIHCHKHEDHIIDHEKSEASKQHRGLVDQSKYVIQREHNQRIHRREVIAESSSAQVRQIHANRQE